ncbi:hypothetical protein [Streptomyces sp. NBC_00035]|uniref:TRADD-N-associated membrane domain-containing protein n=1 Tax=Streptomyces sp. NBC_00035 TaxID=2903614 RepID=UPI00325391EB
MNNEQEVQQQSGVRTSHVLTKLLVTVFAAGSVYTFQQVVNADSSESMSLLVALMVGSTALIIQYLVEFSQVREDEARRERRSEEKEAYQSLVEPDSLKILMDLNQRQIEEYHDIVTAQARRSYRSAQFAMWAGVAMLVACLYVGLRTNPADVKIFAAAMGTVGGAMTGYLSKTYLAVYRETLSQLNRYFDQPVTNGYFLAAERLAGDTMLDMRQRIIEHILLVSMRSGEQKSDQVPPSSAKRNGRRDARGASRVEKPVKRGEAV